MIAHVAEGGDFSVYSWLAFSLCIALSWKEICLACLPPQKAKSDKLPIGKAKAVYKPKSLQLESPTYDA